MDQHTKYPVDARRRLMLKASVAGGVTAGFAAILPRGVRAAEFTYKFATALDAQHPLNLRASEALERIRAATNGRVDIRLFPANQLGSDADTLSQTRSGAVEFMTLGHGNLGNYVKSSGIASVGFADQIAGITRPSRLHRDGQTDPGWNGARPSCSRRVGQPWRAEWRSRLDRTS